MVDFRFNPGQYFTRTPFVNQTVPNSFYNNFTRPQTSGYYNNIGTYAGYNPFNPTPGTVGYRLPAQSYYNYGVNNLSNFGTQTLKTQLVNAAINAGVDAVSNAIFGNPNDPSYSRLYGSGLQGATGDQLLQTSYPNSETAFMDDTEDRVIIYDQSGLFIGNSPVYGPLEDLGGVLFPYTPQIQVSHKAVYENMSLVHTNYITPQYQNSRIDNITLTALFTANYPAEAEYILATMHFFRSVTKMFYGKDQLAGTPPPVLYLDGYGPYTFDHIPVVITGFDYTLPNDVDYISCSTVNGIRQKVPTSINFSISMLPTYSRNTISNKFGLQDFSSGLLVTNSSPDQGPSAGGFL